MSGNWTRRCLILILGFCLVLLNSKSAEGQPTRKFKVGQACLYFHLGNWTDATVIEVEKAMVKVEYQFVGTTRQAVVNRNDLRFVWETRAITMVRTWKDASGKFSIKAAAVGLDPEKGTVTLHKIDDDEEITVPVDKLVAADRELLMSLPEDIGKSNPVADDITKRTGFRMWKSSDGKFQIEARLVENTGDSIKLEKADGKTVDVPLNRLAESDLAFIASLSGNTGENKFAGGEMENQMGRWWANDGGWDDDEGYRPYTGKVVADPPEKTGGYQTIAVNDSIHNPDLSKIPKFKSVKQYAPDPPPGLPNVLPNIAIEYECKTDRPNSLGFSPLIVSPTGKRVAFNIEGSNGPYIVVFDIETGDLIVEETPGKNLDENTDVEHIPLAFSPDGSTLLTESQYSWESENTHLFFWGFKQGDLSLQFQKGWTTETNHSQVVFLNATTLATTNFIGNGYIFDLDKDTVEYSGGWTEITGPAGGCHFSIGGSEDRHDTNTAFSKAVFDLQKKTHIELKNDENRWSIVSGGYQAISPDGKLCVVFNGGIRVVDLVSQEIVAQFSSMTAPGHDSRAEELAFVGQNHVSAGGYLYDIRLNAPVARLVNYETLFTNYVVKRTYTVGGTAIYLNQSDAFSPMVRLVVSNVFTPQTNSAIKQYISGQPVRIGPGARMSVEFDGVDFVASQKIKSNLAEQKIEIANDADFRFSASTERLAAQRAMVRFRDNNTEKNVEVNYSPSVSTMTLAYKGTIIWECKHKADIPGTLVVNQGESAQQAAERMCRPAPGFFDANSIPTNIVLYGPQMPKLIFGPDGIRLEK